MAHLGKAVVSGLLLTGVLLAGGAAAQASVAPAEQAAGSAASTIWPWPDSSSPPLLDGKENWGEPPENDEIVAPLGELPPYAGWYRFINAGWYNGGFCLAAEGLALVESDGALQAFDVATGEQRWQARYPGIDSFSQTAAAGGVLYNGSWGGICAIRLRDGAELWRREGLSLLAAGPDGVWGCQQSVGQDFVARATQLVYLAAADGQARASYNFAATPLDSFWGTPVTPCIALRQDNSIHVYFSDGSSTVLPLHRADWQAACGYLPGGLIVGEAAVPSSLELSELGVEVYARREQELALDPQTGQPGPGHVLYCYDLPGGQLRWRHEFSAVERDRYYGYDNQISCLEGYAILKGWGGTLALSLADGAVAGEIAPLADEGSSSGGIEQLGPADDGLLYIVHEVQSGQVLDCVPADKPGLPATPEQRMQVPTGLARNFVITQGRMVGLLETQGPSRGAGSNRALVSFELTAQGLPVPGAPKVLSAPPLPDALRARFLASPDPLRDPSVLRGVVSAGTGAVLHIARGVDPGQAAQLNALAAIAEYIQQHQSRDSSSNPLQLLCQELAPRAVPEMAPVVLAWLRDPSLGGAREYILDLLARCGGPVAQHALDPLYDAGQAQRHTQPAPPYAFQRAELELKSEAEYVQKAGTWAEADGPAPVRLAVFPSWGLLCGCDLYVAADSNGDGVWEEVLPTGLLDFSYYFMHPGGIAGPGPKGPLALAVQGDELRVTHHQPVYTPQTVGTGPEQYTYMDFTDATRVDSALSLRELRRDTDGDGLSDVTERMLLTDPTRADSDGDNLADWDDPTPLADPARMGPLERGVARALKRCLERDTMYGYGTRREDDARRVFPWRASYIVAYGCGEVAYGMDPREYSICLSTPAQRRAREAQLNGYPNSNAICLSLWRKGMTPQEQRAASRDADAEDSGPGSSPISAAAGFGGLPRDAAIALEVYIDYTTAGYEVKLVEITGEFYPVTCEMTWIS